MKPKRHLHWIIPLGVLLGLLAPEFVDLWWQKVGGGYRKQANQSCGLVHGYAMEFKELKGRAPSEAEMKSWAISRFSEDVRKMKADQERGEAA